MTESGDVVPIRSRERRPLADDVAAHLREEIMSGRLRPGEFIRLDTVAGALGVSNTPVREGLFHLRAEGFVSSVPRRGYVVAQFSRQDVRDLFWAQAQIAGELAGRAAMTITAPQLARLEAIVEEQARATRVGDNDRVAVLGHAFHREINLAANSYRLALILGSVVRQLPNHFYASVEALVDEAEAQHPGLVEALRRRNARKARSMMRDHVAGGAEFVIEMLEQQGLWRGGS